jgi:hypothetical protein
MTGVLNQVVTAADLARITDDGEWTDISAQTAGTEAVTARRRPGRRAARRQGPR